MRAPRIGGIRGARTGGRTTLNEFCPSVLSTPHEPPWECLCLLCRAMQNSNICISVKMDSHLLPDTLKVAFYRRILQDFALLQIVIILNKLGNAGELTLTCANKSSKRRNISIFKGDFSHSQVFLYMQLLQSTFMEEQCWLTSVEPEAVEQSFRGRSRQLFWRQLGQSYRCEVGQS